MIADVVDLEPDDGDITREVAGWATIAVAAAAGFAALTWWIPRVIWGAMLHDRCEQAH